VGEGLEVRKAGDHVAHTLAQLDAALQGVSANDVANIVIAYEPVWAIGTGEVATPADAQEVCGAIRSRIREIHGSVADQTRVLYGGSMKADNVADLMLEPDIDGGLVGGASLDPDEFVSVCRYRLHA
jgi:triosephosphate isomerase